MLWVTPDLQHLATPPELINSFENHPLCYFCMQNRLCWNKFCLYPPLHSSLQTLLCNCLCRQLGLSRAASDRTESPRIYNDILQLNTFESDKYSQSYTYMRNNKKPFDPPFPCFFRKCALAQYALVFSLKGCKL